MTTSARTVQDLRRQVRRVDNVEVLGEPFALPALPRQGEIEWEWSEERRELCATLRGSNGARVTVHIPEERAKRAFAAAMSELGFASDGPTVNGLFSRVKRGLSRAAKAVTPAPARKIINQAQRKLAPIVRDAARVAEKVGRESIKVASHPAFGAAMGALAVTPPLMAVGGPGLAAYAAANKAKHVLAAVDAARRAAPAVTRAAQAARRNPAAAMNAARQIASRAAGLERTANTDPRARLLRSALRSIPAVR